MSTTIIDSWATDISLLGPIYPFAGSEMAFVIAGVLFWISFHVLQLRTEAAELAADAKVAADPEKLRKAIDSS